MTITYPISFPATPGFTRFQPRHTAAVAVSASPFSFEQQVHAHQGQMWMFDVETAHMDRALGEQWVAALMSLNGRQGTFYLSDPTGATPRGVATGTPLINGAGQTGQTITTDGWTNSVTGILRAGDYIQIGSYLHKVLVDANSNGSGQATLEIWPRLRASPADNATIVVSACKGVFRLASNEMGYQILPPAIYRVAFSAVEAL